MRTLAFLLLAAPVLAPAAVDPCAPPEAELKERALAIVERATLGTDARVLVAAAGWWRVGQGMPWQDEAAPEALYARAADLAGPDAVAWSMLARSCGRDCLLQPAPIERWVALDADNAAAWVALAGRALHANDDAAAHAAVARAAHAPRFDGYWVETLRASVAATRSVPLTPALERDIERQGFSARDGMDVEAFGVALAHAMPGLGSVIEACAAHPDWRVDCLRLARTIEATGDSFVVQAQARALQRRLLDEGSADARALAERVRAHEWRVLRMIELTDEPEEMAPMLRRLLATGSEVRATEQALREAGIPVVPPPGWTSEQGQAELRQAAVERREPDDCPPPAAPSKP
ncbi:MAG TPA: hypothetical protein VFL14_00665 [Xanthomonadales bacterium]|nr:hypothetical protein [Xanthomonadales bacterium]